MVHAILAATDSSASDNPCSPWVPWAPSGFAPLAWILSLPRPLTRRRFPGSFSAVSFLRRFIAVALLALWLPATLHCALEAAGLKIAFVCHDHDDGHGHSHPAPAPDHHGAQSHTDACHPLEDAAIKPTSVAKLVGQATFFLIAFLPVPPELPVDRVCPERTDVPRELGRGWQFATRAAPLARAPSASV